MKRCLACGCLVMKHGMTKCFFCKSCGFEWRECSARGGENLMYRKRSIWGWGSVGWEDIRWFYVAAGTLGIFSEVEV